MPVARTDRQFTVRHRPRIVAIVLGTVIAMLLLTAPMLRAEHEGTNLLQFAPVADSPSPRAMGSGMIRFRGGAEPTSRWTATFEFAGLEPDTPYVVLVMGRTGADGTEAARAFSPLCDFSTDSDGAGLCWDYELGLRRLGVVQLRRDDETGTVVLQATRDDDGPGTIESVPNQFTPVTTAPFASPLPSNPPPAG